MRPQHKMKVAGLLEGERLLVRPTPCFYWKVIPMAVPRTSTAEVREEILPVEPRRSAGSPSSEYS